MVRGMREGSLSLVKLQASVFDLPFVLFALQYKLCMQNLLTIYIQRKGILYLQTKIDLYEVRQELL